MILAAMDYVLVIPSSAMIPTLVPTTFAQMENVLTHSTRILAMMEMPVLKTISVAMEFVLVNLLRFAMITTLVQQTPAILSVDAFL